MERNFATVVGATEVVVIGAGIVVVAMVSTVSEFRLDMHRKVGSSTCKAAISGVTMAEQASYPDRSDTLPKKKRASKRQLPFHCDDCSKLLITKTNLSSHVAAHWPQFALFCDTCGRKFGESWTLGRHVLKDLHTARGTLYLYYCDSCGLDYSASQPLARHSVRHL